MCKVRPGICCRGSYALALAQNLTGKCATEVNRIWYGLVCVLYTRTGTNTLTCELHKMCRVTQAELQLLQHCVRSVEKLFKVVHKREHL